MHACVCFIVLASFQNTQSIAVVSQDLYDDFVTDCNRVFVIPFFQSRQHRCVVFPSSEIYTSRQGFVIKKHRDSSRGIRHWKVRLSFFEDVQNAILYLRFHQGLNYFHFPHQLPFQLHTYNDFEELQNPCTHTKLSAKKEERAVT